MMINTFFPNCSGCVVASIRTVARSIRTNWTTLTWN